MIKNYNNNLIEKNDCLILSVSGGIDSMVMLHYIHRLKDELNLTIHIAHIDHQKRNESSEDAEFVKQTAHSLNLPFHLHVLEDETYDNFHHYAHIKRYDFLHQVAKDVDANKIVLAHHLNDLAETILMRMTRGSSFEGYRGILDQTIYKGIPVIRPFLGVSKESLEQYLRSYKIEYRQDATNNEDDYTRNRFRNTIMPLLEKENPLYLEKFAQFSNYQIQAYALIDHNTNLFFDNIYKTKEKISFNIIDFNKEFLIIQIETIKRVINYITNDSLELSYQNIQDIILLLNNEKPNVSFQIKNLLYIYKNYNQVSFQTHEEIKEDFEHNFTDFGKYNLENDFNVEISRIPNKNYDYIYKLCYNNLDLVFPLTIRNRRPGDWLNIQIGTKKLKDFFIDKKLPISERNNLPMVVGNKKEILYIPGLFEKQNQGKKCIYIHLNKTKY